MMSMVLKTHEMIRDFENSGFSKQQAEAIADWQTKIAENTFATKADLQILKVSLIRWYVGTSFAVVGVMLAVASILVASLK
ncbi:hypothetical protein ACHHRT_12735 [Desulfurivibrio sp. D14AmB]|uniref:hypothetical protein n=1 Tax=Desulfurivibrio sp. D14AmB TaxID=3374370 RepID=UPI00376ED15C